MTDELVTVPTPESGLSRILTSGMTKIQDPSTVVFPGHLGHLSAAQEEILAAFKASLVEATLYTDTGKPSHDDATLLYVHIVVTSAPHFDLS